MSARQRAAEAALQRAPGNMAGTVATSIADAASDEWEPFVRRIRDMAALPGYPLDSIFEVCEEALGG